MRTSRTTLIVLLSTAVLLTAAAAPSLSPAGPAYAAGSGTAAAASRPASPEEAGRTLALAAGTAAAAPGGLKPAKGMEEAAANGKLVLYVNRKTAEIAVGDKESGHIWYSSPQDRGADEQATAFEKDALASQFSLTFIDNVGNEKTFYSYSDAAKNGQFEIKPIEGGVRILYTLGDMSKGIDALPKKISKARLDSFMAKIDKSAADYTYHKYDFDKATGVYTRFDSALQSPLTLNKVLKAFADAGYTEEDLAKDNAENHVGDSARSKPVFQVAVEFRLDGGSLLVSVPTADIKEPKDFTVTKLALLEYFGAGGLGDQGYMLVPDGSGSLIDLNNGKSRDDIYSQPVYGEDEAVRIRHAEQNSEGVRLPVFGIKTNDSALYGIIEDGAAVAGINAEVSGRTNSYNYVYSSFTLRQQDQLALGNGQTFNYIGVLQARPTEGAFSVRYGFLAGGDADYAGIAAAYRDYLIRKYRIEPVPAGKDLPFYLDLVGSIPKRKTFLGVPYEAMVPLTTFSEATAIVGKLLDARIGNIKLRYLGWFNKGVNHKLPTSLSVDGELGGRRGLADLQAYLKANGASLYPDVSFLRVYHDTWTFSPSHDASRYITRRVVEKYPYDLAYQRMNRDLGHDYLTSPGILPTYVDRFLNRYGKMDIDGLSVRFMGESLDPDYRVGKLYDRGQSETTVSAQLKKLGAAAPDLLVTGGNAYALPYARNVIDAPLSDSRYNVTDEPVPFYEMVLHGLIPYAGKPVNLADDQDSRKELLKALEYGASLHFTWIYAPPESVKDTEYNSLYSVHYGDWLEKAKAMYAELNKALADVQDQAIVGHRKLREGVYATTYANGKTILVNYNAEAVTVNGRTIPAMDYAMGGNAP